MDDGTPVGATRECDTEHTQLLGRIVRLEKRVRDLEDSQRGVLIPVTASECCGGGDCDT